MTIKQTKIPRPVYDFQCLAKLLKMYEDNGAYKLINVGLYNSSIITADPVDMPLFRWEMLWSPSVRVPIGVHHDDVLKVMRNTRFKVDLKYLDRVNSNQQSFYLDIIVPKYLINAVWHEIPIGLLYQRVSHRYIHQVTQLISRTVLTPRSAPHTIDLLEGYKRRGYVAAV